MTVKLPTIRRRNLEDSLNLPYDSLRLSFRTTPPSSSASPRFRFDFSTGIPTANGNTSKRSSSEAAPSLPEANPAGQQFLVQEAPSAPSEPRPPSQEARKGGSRAQPSSSRLAPSQSDLAGINVFQLELRQPPQPTQPPPVASNGGSGGISRTVAGLPARPTPLPAASSSSTPAATALPTRSRHKAVLNSGSAGITGGDVMSLANSLKATPEGDTDSASVGSYSGSLPPRLQANSRLNGATCQASLHLSATHMAATSRKPSRQLPLPATNKSNDSKFCYPDPVSGANNSFHQRLAEMAALEADTVRWERARLFRRKLR